jgi:hypothetical protein
VRRIYLSKQASKFDLVINLITARAARPHRAAADEVIDIIARLIGQWLLPF